MNAGSWLTQWVRSVTVVPAVVTLDPSLGGERKSEHLVAQWATCLPLAQAVNLGFWDGVHLRFSSLCLCQMNK